MAALPGVGFVQAYGMTELAPLATVNPAYYHTVEGRKLGKLRAAGRPGYCVELRIVDANDNEVPRGTVGEVVVRGPNVMQGYWNKPEQTAAVLRDGWMHTGDGAWMDDDGFIFIADRLKDMIITRRRERLFGRSRERACAAPGRGRVRGDRRTERAVGRVGARGGGAQSRGTTSSADALIAHCKALIAGYKCPRSVEFVDALPISGAGKVLKTKLREPFWQGRERAVA